MVGKESKKKVHVLEKFRCGECIHFKKHALNGRKEVCSKLGVKAFAVAPPCFTPDVSKVLLDSDHLVSIASLFNEYTHSQRRILVAMLMGRKKKLKFGQKVYFKAIGKEYISNYLSGFVVGHTRNGDVLISGDPDKKRRGSSYTAILNPSSCILPKQWKSRRQKLIKAKRISDPDLPLIKFKKRQVIDDYEPKTIDSAPAHWHTKEEEKPRKKKDSKWW